MSCLQHTACQSSHLTKGNYADFQCLWKYDFFIICSQIPRIWGWCKYVSEKWRNFLSGSCKAHRVYISVDKIHDSKMQLRIREKLNNLHFWVFFPFSCLFFFLQGSANVLYSLLCFTLASSQQHFLNVRQNNI